MKLRLAWAALTWLVYMTVHTAFSIIGVLAVPIAIAFGVTRRSRIYPDREIFTAPGWLWLWGNEEEGYDSAFAVALHPRMNTNLRRFLWAAWRNKANNFRFIKWLHPPPDPDRIAFHMNTRGFLCWQGVLHQLRYDTSNLTFKIGWRYEPVDAMGVGSTDWRLHGCGFTFRVILK